MNDSDNAKTRQSSMPSPFKPINILLGVVRDSLPYFNKSIIPAPPSAAKFRSSRAPVLVATTSRAPISPVPPKRIASNTNGNAGHLISAIYRAPPEIWTEILSFAAPSSQSPLHPSEHPAFALSHVSSFLRSLTCDIPSLWTTFAITRGDHDKAPEKYAEFVRAWLRRTRGHPISLTVNWVPFETAPPPDLLDIIDSYAPAISSLNLSVPASTLRRVLSYRLPQLTTLTLAIRVPMPPSGESETLCPHAPMLSKIQLLGSYQNPVTLGLPMGQVTDLVSRYPLPAAQTLALLAEAPLLQTASVRVVAPSFMLTPLANDDDDDNAFPPLSPTAGHSGPPILTTLPHLTSLTITSENAGPLLTSLRAPELSSLSLVSVDRREGIMWPASEVVNLSAPLRSLTVKGRKVKVGEMKRVLRSNKRLRDVTVDWMGGMEDAGENALKERRKELEAERV